MSFTGLLFSKRQKIHRQARRVLPEPTKPQQVAGNYRKGHIHILGLAITIETARGQVRSGVAKNGTAWAITMPHHYGYIRRTLSEADGDHIDVFVGPHPESESVFVVNQLKADGKFDEHKCMLGFLNKADAKRGYLDSYSAGWTGLGGIVPMTLPQFKDWIFSGDTAKPVEEHRPLKKVAEYWCRRCHELWDECQCPGREKMASDDYEERLEQLIERRDPDGIDPLTPHITPRRKEQRTKVEEYEVCPHCNEEIGEKSIYVDDDGYEYHRGCQDAGPIGRLSDDWVEHIRASRGIKEAAAPYLQRAVAGHTPTWDASQPFLHNIAANIGEVQERGQRLVADQDSLQRMQGAANPRVGWEQLRKSLLGEDHVTNPIDKLMFRFPFS